MSRRQIMLVGLIAAALMALIPPWRVHVPTDYGGVNASIGYDLIVTPPNPLASVDLGRLVAQWMAVGALTALGIALAKGKPRNSG